MNFFQSAAMLLIFGGLTVVYFYSRRVLKRGDRLKSVNEANRSNVISMFTAADAVSAGAYASCDPESGGCD